MNGKNARIVGYKTVVIAENWDAEELPFMSERVIPTRESAGNTAIIDVAWDCDRKHIIERWIRVGKGKSRPVNKLNHNATPGIHRNERLILRHAGQQHRFTGARGSVSDADRHGRGFLAADIDHSPITRGPPQHQRREF
jgi:hypothetical protein